MSRAFVKEADGEQPGEELPERPQSPHPNYVTASGLKALQEHLTKLQEERRHLTEAGEPEMLDKEHLKLVERDIRYFQERIERVYKFLSRAGRFEDTREIVIELVQFFVG